MPNAELAYKTLDFIDANPGQWNQRDWNNCFGGLAVKLAGGEVVRLNSLGDERIRMPDGQEGYAFSLAEVVLGLSGCTGPATLARSWANWWQRSSVPARPRPSLGCAVWIGQERGGAFLSEVQFLPARQGSQRWQTVPQLRRCLCGPHNFRPPKACQAEAAGVRKLTAP